MSFDRNGRLTWEAWIKVPYVGMLHDFAVTRTHVAFLVDPDGDECRADEAGPGALRLGLAPAHLVRRAAPRRRRQRPALVQGAGALCDAHDGDVLGRHPPLRRHGHGGDEPVSVLPEPRRRAVRPGPCAGARDASLGGSREVAARLRDGDPVSRRTASFRARTTVTTRCPTASVSCRRSTPRVRSTRSWRRARCGRSTAGHASIMRNGGRRPYFPGPESSVQECCFVPRHARAAEGDGYLVGVVNRWLEGRNDLLVLDATASRGRARWPPCACRRASTRRSMAGGCRTSRNATAAADLYHSGARL